MVVKSTDVGSIGGTGYLDTGQQSMRLKKLAPPQTMAAGSFENWGESAMADTSQQTDTSTDIDTDERNQVHKLEEETEEKNSFFISFQFLAVNGFYVCFLFSFR